MIINEGLEYRILFFRHLNFDICKCAFQIMICDFYVFILFNNKARKTAKI